MLGVLKTALDIVASALTADQPEALLVGGQALPAYGVVRQTLDVDCLATEQNADKLRRALVAAGYVEAAQSPAVVRYRHDSPWLMDVDILMVEQSVYTEMLRDSRSWKHGNHTWRVPSLAHLIALKLHSMKHNPDRRGHDQSDIVSLLQHNPGMVNPAELRQLCEKYGPPDVAEQLKELRS